MPQSSAKAGFLWLTGRGSTGPHQFEPYLWAVSAAHSESLWFCRDFGRSVITAGRAGGFRNNESKSPISWRLALIAVFRHGNNPRFYRVREKSGARNRRTEKKMQKLKPPCILAEVWRPHCKSTRGSNQRKTATMK